MHPEEAAFHQNIIDNPHDETAPLVYADWLEEHGNRPATAEMIRRGISDARRFGGLGNSTTELRRVGDHEFAEQNQLEVGAGAGGTHRDIVALHLPIGKDHYIRLDPYVPRADSKRLISQLQKEGHPTPIYNNDEFESDKNDYSNTPPSAQMSRDKTKPLIVSYEKHLSRFCLNKRYAASTVARVMGHGSYGNETAPIHVGSRLATVLREIKHGIGKNNPTLDKLTTHALGGTHKPEVYTAIRDELFRSKDPRAVQLARQYNWHKVGEGLERDRHLKQFVENSAKGTTHEGHSQTFRRFYNGVVHGKSGPDENTRQLFYKTMRKHLQNSTGKDHTYEQIEDSLRRLGETEENRERLGSGKGNAKFELPDYEHPAYTGVPKEGKAPPKRQVTSISKRAPGQYTRPRFRFKL